MAFVGGRETLELAADYWEVPPKKGYTSIRFVILESNQSVEGEGNRIRGQPLAEERHGQEAEIFQFCCRQKNFTDLPQDGCARPQEL
jgi:hypothetical protein